MGYGREDKEKLSSFSTRARVVVGNVFKQPRPLVSSPDRRPGEELISVCQNEPAAVDKVNNILDGIGEDMDDVIDRARAHKARELAQHYGRRRPGAVKLIHRLLAKASVSIDALRAEAVAKKLDDIERIDHQITIAESRRNASLHEIDRRRAVSAKNYVGACKRPRTRI